MSESRDLKEYQVTLGIEQLRERLKPVFEDVQCCPDHTPEYLTEAVLNVLYPETERCDLCEDLLKDDGGCPQCSVMVLPRRKNESTKRS